MSDTSPNSKCDCEEIPGVGKAHTYDCVFGHSTNRKEECDIAKLTDIYECEGLLGIQRLLSEREEAAFKDGTMRSDGYVEGQRVLLEEIEAAMPSSDAVWEVIRKYRSHE